MSKVNSGQVGRLNDLVVLTEQTPLAIVNAENDIVAATYQSCPVLAQSRDQELGETYKSNRSRALLLM